MSASASTGAAVFVIYPVAEPLYPDGGLAVLRGSLAPSGALIKSKAATAELLEYRGRAVVFDGLEDLERRKASLHPPRLETRGYTRIYQEHVLQADEGCDLDFLRAAGADVSDAQSSARAARRG